MSGVILGTAGHIDHGKTALVRALTGVDTDRLEQEKARGITIELGFAELALEHGPRFGVVDVPGHEAFVRTMVAGACGMDVVLLVVAADEGVMPQTCEHLAIVELLGVPELVVALTKCDLVEPEWLELVRAEVSETLADTPYHAASLVATSSTAGTGMDELLDALVAAAARVKPPAPDDLTRLPLDRVFTMPGTGTVVTGTLWSGSLSIGDRVRILPNDVEARVRTLQVHGREVASAAAGDRTAVALVGAGADRELVVRGATLVSDPEWSATWMLTVRLRVLPEVGWGIEHNQRVHVHLGTATALARCALLEPEALGPGDTGWVQLRLEEPLVARALDRLVIRAYSPVTTIAGAVVAEPDPPKRRKLDAATRSWLGAVLEADASRSVPAHLELAGWAGARLDALPVAVGLSRPVVARALVALGSDHALITTLRGYGPATRERAERIVLEAVERAHRENPLRSAVPLALVRAALPPWAPDELADATIRALVGRGVLIEANGGVRDPEHRAVLTAEQEEASARLERALAEGGLAPPSVDELPDDLRTRRDLWPLLRRLEETGRVRQIADGLYVDRAQLDDAERRIRETLGGQRGLGPSAFKDALPVSRKYLLPLLAYFDGLGTTVRRSEGRDVPAERL